MMIIKYSGWREITISLHKLLAPGTWFYVISSSASDAGLRIDDGHWGGDIQSSEDYMDHYQRHKEFMARRVQKNKRIGSQPI